MLVLTLGEAMRQRDFIALLGGGAAWPLSARAQQSTRVATIGFLDATSRSTQGQIASEFVQTLRELGWRDGQNLVAEVRWAEGRPERYAQIAAEFCQAQSRCDCYLCAASDFRRKGFSPQSRQHQPFR